MAKSRKNSSRKSNTTQIVLWILFSLSVVGLIISIVVQCRNNEDFEIIDGQLPNGPAEVITSPHVHVPNISRNSLLFMLLILLIKTLIY